MKIYKNIPLKSIALKEGFWKTRTDMAAQDMIPYQWETINNRTPGAPLSHAVENFRIAAGESDGEPQGTIFQDSDIAKWIEAAAYSLTSYPDEQLEISIDELIRLIEKSQLPDGYVNTFFIAAGDDKRWSDLIQGHELYCAGHMIEAAVGYFEATGKRKLLDVMCRYADYIDSIFGTEKGKKLNYDGHPEIELALYRLAEATGSLRYRRLAEHFVNIRGTIKDFHVGIAAKEGMIPKSKWFYSDYYIAHQPVRDMTRATGHSVRAVYLYSAMADYCRLKPDSQMLKALKSIWENTINHQMYITAALGSQSHGERFTIDYDLPNDTAYAETCASVGLVFWAWRMLLIDPHRQYADIIERALYNSALSGISLDGMHYFYVNPLEVAPRVVQNRFDHSHVMTHREKWFDCACCPTNIGRLITSIGGYLSSVSENEIWIHQFASSSIKYELNGKGIKIIQKTNYPWDGQISIKVDPDQEMTCAINIRIPGWCRKYTLELNGSLLEKEASENGYITFEKQWEKGDIFTIHLKMEPTLYEANQNVRENSGRVALMRGPLVYCLEENDNGAGLHELMIHPETEFNLVQPKGLLKDTVAIQFKGLRKKTDEKEGRLYQEYKKTALEECLLTAIPYFEWGNRNQDQEMLVWLRA